MSFVHLHNHTQYSLLDGACRVDKIIQKAVDYGMTAVAMTDHGNMYGAIDFYNTAKAKGIKPIIGLECYLIDGEYDDNDSKQKPRYHLILLVKDFTGYKNLMKITSISFTEGYYYKPRVSKSVLAKYSEGLICLSACVQGEIPRLLLQNRKADAEKALQFYKETFPDRFYLEIQDHFLDDERAVMPQVVALAKATETPIVVTNDCHYLNREDAEAHDVLLCIQTAKTLDDPNRMKYNTTELYFKPEEEMRKLFPDLPDAYDNTVKIAEEIDLTLAYDEFLLPKIDIPDNFATMGEYLRHLCYEGVKDRYPSLTDEIKDRIDYELGVINKMGFDGYFLVVKDFIDTARAQGIPVGPGRGSAAGSIVSYLLDITRLDPLQYHLFFERFLNPERIGMPDIDIDFCAEGRGQVIDYVVQKYGRNSVCQIVTFGTLGAKSVIKDVARVMGVPAADANAMTKLMPDTPKSTLQSALKESPEFADLMASDAVYSTVLKHSLVLEGLVRQIGIHAAGVVIGPGDLSDYVPLSVSPQKGGENAVLVQYEGRWLDDLKLLKMDFLGLKTLTLIKKTVELIKQSQNIEVDIDHVDLSDKKSYELLAQGQTDGIFQFESNGMKKYLMELEPNVFEDLIAMVALYRPGPMQYIDTFIKRKHGKEAVHFDHPLTEGTLRETYGVTVYQEQVMQMSRDMGGFTGAQADSLRKAMGKKKIDVMEKYFQTFKQGATANGVEEPIIEKIWNEWKKFAEYAFNKSHAACYAYVAFQTAYLKAHYPVEFMAALLSLESDAGKVTYFLDECKSMGIQIIPPSVNQSEKEFAVHGDKILFGLRGIKNVGDAAINSIIQEREVKGPYSSMANLVTRTDSTAVNKTVLESLIAAGAFDELPGNRAQKTAAIETVLEYAAQVIREKKSGQISLFDAFAEETEEVETEPPLPEAPEWPFTHKLEMEKNVLGFYISGHPIMEQKLILDLLVNANSTYKEEEEDRPISEFVVAGILVGISKKKDSRGRQMAFLTLEDMNGKFEVSLFSREVEKYLYRLQIGVGYLVVGKKSDFNSRDDGVLRLVPKDIIAFEDFPKKLKGLMTINLPESDMNTEYALMILEACKENHGLIKLQFVAETEKFKQLRFWSDTLLFFPSNGFLSFATDNRHRISLKLEWDA